MIYRSDSKTPTDFLPRNYATQYDGSMFRFLFKPVDIASLVFFRIAFGLIMLWEICQFFYHGWIHEYFIRPEYHFSYYGLDWLHPLKGYDMYILFVVLGLLALLITIGLLYRISTLLFFIGFSYVFLLDQTNYQNHFYLMCLISFLMIFIPAHRDFSIDALIRPAIKSGTVPAWGLWILRFQIGIVYFYGGLTKLNSDWLFHGEPMGLYLYLNSDISVIGHILMERWVVYLFSYGGLLFDLLVVPMLLWRKTRPYAFVAAVIFHLMNSQLFTIGIFPWFMIVATTIFLSPSWPRNLLRRFLPISKIGEPKYTGRSLLSVWQKATVTLIVIYLTIQILVPFRHFLYPGNVRWTEEGHFFSWQMMLRFKMGRLKFIATNPKTKKTWEIDRYGRYINRRQLNKLKQWPHLALQYSDFLAEEIRREGQGNVEIFALAAVSLNGRKPQLAIDPLVNLAEERYSLMPARWIKPLSEPLPPISENVFYNIKFIKK